MKTARTSRSSILAGLFVRATFSRLMEFAAKCGLRYRENEFKNLFWNVSTRQKTMLCVSRPTFRRFVWFLSALTLAMVGPTQAQTIVKTSSSGALSTPSLWFGGKVPGSANIAQFNVNAGASQSDTLGANLIFGELNITNPTGTVTIGNDTTAFSLTLNGVVNSTGINVGIDMSAATQNLNFGGANDSLIIGAAQSWLINAGQTLTLNGAVSGTGNITITATPVSGKVATVTLNSVAGNLNGNFILGSSDVMNVNVAQSTATGFFLYGGSTLNTNQAMSSANVISVASGSVTFTDTVATNATFVGNGNLSFTIPNNSSIANFNGVSGVVTLGNTGRIEGTPVAPFATLNMTGATNVEATGASTIILGGVESTAAASNDFGNPGALTSIFVGSNNTNTTWSGGLFGGSATTNFTKVGSGTLTLAPTAGVWTSTTGAENIAVDGGILQADYGLNTTNTNDATTGIFLNTNGSTLSFDGGELLLQGYSASGKTTAQGFGAVTVGAGGGTLAVNPNGGTSTTVSLGTLTATTAGGTLNIQPPTASQGSGTLTITTTSNVSASPTSSAAGAIFNPRITYGSDWATGATSGTSTITNYTGYNVLAPTFTGGTDTTNDQISDTTKNLALTSNYTANSLSINSPLNSPNGAATQLDLGGHTLTLTSGGLLDAGTAGNSFTLGVSTGDTIESGTSGNSDLIIQQLGTDTLTIAATIANGNGVSTLTQGGSGQVFLTGTNTYTGATYLNGGTTGIIANNNLGAGSGASGALYLNGGTLQALDTFTLDNGSVSTARPVNLGGDGGTIDVAGGSTLTIDGVIANNVANEYGALTLIDTGTLVLTGANTYQGATIITGGILSTNSLANGGVVSGIGESSSAGFALVLNGGTLQYTGSGASTNRTFTLGAASGTLDASGSGALNFTSTLPELYSGSGARKLTLTGTGIGTLAAAITDATSTTGASGLVSLLKSGNGTWTISGANTYSGATTVNKGILNLTGSAGVFTNTTTINSTGILNVLGNLTASNVSVTSAATLGGGGNGKTTGVINVNGAITEGGTISMLDGANILTINTQTPNTTTGTLILGPQGGTSTLDLGVGPSTANLISLGTNLLEVDGATSITITNDGVLSGKTYTLMKYGGVPTAANDPSSVFATGSGTTVGGFTLTDPTLAFGVAGSLNVTSTALSLVTTGAAAPLTAYWSGKQGTTWTANNGTIGNFTTDLGGTNFVQSYPGSSTPVYFSGTGATNLTNTLGNNFDIASLTFLGSSGNNGAVTIGADGHTLTLEAAGLTVQSGAGADTINANVALDVSQTWANQSASNLTVGGVISDSGSSTLTINNSSTGYTTLSGANTYAGGTVLAGGITYINNTTGSGIGSGTVTVNSGATLAGLGTLAPTILTGYAVTVNSGGNVTPGGVQPAPLYTLMPTNLVNGSLKIDPTSVTSGQLLSVVTSTSLSVPALTFALGSSNTSSQIDVAGTATNIINFNVGGTSGPGGTSSVVSINDLIGSNLSLSTLYVLIAGNGNTTYDDNGLTLAAAGDLGTSTAYGQQILGGLSLLGSTATNYYSQNYSNGALFLNGDNIDLVNLGAVPEPSTWAMMLGGLALLLVRQWRKKKVS
jgi:autotransporter-associated beta strand protein